MTQRYDIRRNCSRVISNSIRLIFDITRQTINRFNNQHTLTLDRMIGQLILK